VVKAIRDRGSDIPVVLGGIVPNQDVEELTAVGIAAVLGPGAPADEVVEVVRRVAGTRA
jgi:methylmalonyl-CoA mutase C-terminal domain/subunit